MASSRARRLPAPSRETLHFRFRPPRHRLSRRCAPAPAIPACSPCTPSAFSRPPTSSSPTTSSPMKSSPSPTQQIASSPRSSSPSASAAASRAHHSGWHPRAHARARRRGKNPSCASSPGDPLCIFGRVPAEEIAFLTEHCIPFEIVPGITAAFAVAAQLRTPLTDRSSASKLIFATAHHAKEKVELTPKWQGAFLPRRHPGRLHARPQLPSARR